jgi:hypothetical protein
VDGLADVDVDVDVDVKARDCSNGVVCVVMMRCRDIKACFFAAVVVVVTLGTNAVQDHWSSCSSSKHKEKMAAIAVRRDNILIFVIVIVVK